MRTQNPKWQRLLYQVGLPLGEDGRRVTVSPAHLALSRRAAGEGMVLLKNENGTLPLAAGTRVALFGKASVDYVMCGGGSGTVTVPHVHNLCDGMAEKEAAGRVRVFLPLERFYRAEVARQYDAGVTSGMTTEPELPDDLLQKARDFADVAIISLCRFSGEGKDRRGVPHDGDFYLSAAEEAMVEKVTAAFDRCVVVLNVGGMVDSSWFRKNDGIGAVLLGWQGGLEGGMAEADILCGDVCPSGRLTDTFAASFDDYPSSATFGESRDYVTYTDDIYVGYRYFETIPAAREKVNYCFGFGLSYTEFAVSCTAAYEKDGVITVKAHVTNTGARAGKEVVQVYFSAPAGKLGKPACELAAFAKTDLLRPGESRDLSLCFPVRQMASFDDAGRIARSAFVLEAGDYTVFLGRSCENKTAVLTYTLKKDAVTEQLASRCAPHKLPKRLRADGSYESLPVSDYPPDEPEHPTWDDDNALFAPRTYPPSGPALTLRHVAEGEATLDAFLETLSTTELLEQVGGQPATGVSDTNCIGGNYKKIVPYAATADGPAGVRLLADRGVVCTAWPIATLLACTWDERLVEEVGHAAGLEIKENNLAVWLAPGMNIHRSPLCGRNFEYYSEDPLIAGKTAAAMVRGVQSNRVAACVKHFCCNNKEENRLYSDSIVSERALREIYLRGFEIAVREAEPYVLMTSYNKLNGLYSSANRELITDILRGEWGYRGLVISDWCTVPEHYREILAGNDVKMPWGKQRRVQKALDEGLISREDLIPCVKRVMELLLKLD